MRSDAALYAALRAKIAARLPAVKPPALGPDWRRLAAWYVLRHDRARAPLRHAWTWLVDREALRLRAAGVEAALETWLHGRVAPDRLARLAARVGTNAPVVRLLLYVSRARSGTLLADPAFADVYAVLREQGRV